MALLSTLKVAVQAEGIARTVAGLQAVETEGKRAADSAEKLERKFSNLDKGVGDFNRTITFMRNTMRLIKWPGMIAGAGIAAQAVGALGGASVGLVSALGPLVGAGAGAAAGYVALGQAAGVVQLATAGLNKALNGNKKALQALTPAQRELYDVLQGVKEQIRGLQNRAAAGLLPGVTDAIRSVTPLLGRFRTIVTDTATAFGGLARRAGTMAATWGPDITRVGKTNVTVIRNIGFAALSAADALRHIVVVGGPLLTWMSNVVRTGAQWVDQQVQAGRESGRLAAFLTQTREVMATVVRIAVNLGAAFYQIGRAAAPLGRTLLSDIEKLTARFRAWTDSVQGQRTLQQYFRDALGPIREMAGLVGDLGAAFLRLSRPTNATTGIARELRDLVPVLETVIASTSASFGPAFIASLTQVVRLLGELAGTSGPLTLFIQTIGILAGALADLLASSPALNQMLVFWLGVKSVWGALAILGAPVAAAFEIVTTASFRAAAGARAVAVATALLSTSVLLPVAALAALGVAFVIAYQHSEEFRRIVNSVVVWLQQAWPETMAILVTSTRAAMNVLRTIWYLNLALFAPPVVAMWTLVKGVFSGALIAIQGIVRGGFQIVRGVITLFTGLIKGDFGQMWEGVKTIFRGGITAVRGILDGAWTILKAPVNAIAAGLREGFTGAWDSVKKAFESGVNALIGFLNLLREGLNIVLKAVGVKPIPPIPELGGGGKGGGGKAGSFGGQAPASGALARGGAFARTGGYVNKPITLMGEEAPAHPEYVIPSNPAYRKRAQSLVMQAAAAVGMARGGKLAMDRMQGTTREQGTAVPGRAIGLARGGMIQADRSVPGEAKRPSSARAQARKVTKGFAQGGIYSQGEIENLWTDQGGASARRLIASAIAMAESSGNANATSANPAGGQNLGLWQIWTGNPGSTLDPGGNARTAIRLSRNGTDWGLWETFTNGAYKQFLGKGRAGGQIGGLPAISDILGKFPSINDLPEWVRGIGKFMVDKAIDFVKKQIGDLFSEGSGTGLAAKGKGGVGSFQGVPMANWVIDSLRYAQSKGVEVRPTSGYRPGFDPHTASGASEHQGTKYPHGAVDFGGYHDAAALAMKMAVVQATADFKYPLLAPIGFVDDGHASGTGHKRGGIYGDTMTAFREGGKLIGQTGMPNWPMPETMGVAGKAGDAGLPGQAGRPSVPGLPGKAGTPGMAGRMGKGGAFGAAGMPGVGGTPGLAGKGGQAGDAGKLGIIALAGKTGLAWKAVGGKAGQAGSGGKAGAAGMAGAPGLPGKPGPAGKGAEWLGGFKAGGFTGSREGLAYLHKHEAVIPMARGGVSNLGRGNLLRNVNPDGVRWLQPSYGTPAPSPGAPRPGYTPPDVPVADTTADTAPDNQALIDAIQANTDAINAEAELERQRIALETIIQSNQLKILAMRGQGDQILAAVVAAVNGGIGGSVGLGFQSPSTAGTMARYK